MLTDIKNAISVLRSVRVKYKQKIALLDARDAASLESAMYHLPICASASTPYNIVITYAAISIRDITNVMISSTVRHSPEDKTKLKQAVVALTSLIQAATARI